MKEAATPVKYQWQCLPRVSQFQPRVPRRCFAHRHRQLVAFNEQHLVDLQIFKDHVDFIDTANARYLPQVECVWVCRLDNQEFVRQYTGYLLCNVWSRLSLNCLEASFHLTGKTEVSNEHRFDCRRWPTSHLLSGTRYCGHRWLPTSVPTIILRNVPKVSNETSTSWTYGWGFINRVGLDSCRCKEVHAVVSSRKSSFSSFSS